MTTNGFTVSLTPKTRWDRWGTEVSGSQSLIDDLISDPDLETIE